MANQRGKGRLTDVVIDSMQTYYGMAIRNNLPDVDAKSIATKAILHHSVVPFTPSQRRPYPAKQMGKKNQRMNRYRKRSGKKKKQRGCKKSWKNTKTATPQYMGNTSFVQTERILGVGGRRHCGRRQSSPTAHVWKVAVFVGSLL